MFIYILYIYEYILHILYIIRMYNLYTYIIHMSCEHLIVPY